MSSDLALSVRGLGKRYTIGAARPVYRTVGDRFSEAATSFARRVRGQTAIAGPVEELWALRDVSFDVGRGEVIGVVGGNGAGKSTLLKVLSRITEPTEGRAVVHGRVGSLLEVGTGFHAELTGRENIYLNGAILGMSHAEVRRKLDAIVEFSGVAKFLDTPVRFFSSGMYARLAFSVAAHMEPDILVVDEVLAVGDMTFQRKCLGKLNDVSREGRTVLFVSHNLDAVQRLCRRGLLLNRGHLQADGPIGEVMSLYRAQMGADDALGRFVPHARRGLGWARFTDVRLVHEGRRVGVRPSDGDLQFELDLALTGDVGTLRGQLIELNISTDDGQPLVSLISIDHDAIELPDGPACTIGVRIPGPTFAPGLYRVRVYLGLPNLTIVDEIDEAVTFEITPPDEPWRPFALEVSRGPVVKPCDWTLAGQGVVRA